MNKIKLILSYKFLLIIPIAVLLFWQTLPMEIRPLGANEIDIPDYADPDLGEKLVKIGNCESCHTGPEGKPFAGGYGIKTNFGTIYSTNITPDNQTGIGFWSYEAFKRAIEKGIDREGNHLYPAFPYYRFTAASEQDIASIYAFLKTRVEPINFNPPKTKLNFPFSFRPGLRLWNAAFLDEKKLTSEPSEDLEWSRGKYLVETLGHCGSCHSPRNVFGAEEIGQLAYSGALIGSWYAPPLKFAKSPSISFDQNSFVNYLLDGWDKHLGIAVGPMIKVSNNLYDINEDDAFAISKYLLSLSENSEILELPIIGDYEDKIWNRATAVNSKDYLAGSKIFEKQCASCHKLNGKPSTRGFVNSINQPLPNNLIHVVLNGIKPSTGSAEKEMPDRGLMLSDDQIVQLLIFLRQKFTDQPLWKNPLKTVSMIRNEDK